MSSNLFLNIMESQSGDIAFAISLNIQQYRRSKMRRTNQITQNMDSNFNLHILQTRNHFISLFFCLLFSQNPSMIAIVTAFEETVPRELLYSEHPHSPFSSFFS